MDGCGRWVGVVGLLSFLLSGGWVLVLENSIAPNLDRV